MKVEGSKEDLVAQVAEYESKLVGAKRSRAEIGHRISDLNDEIEDLRSVREEVLISIQALKSRLSSVRSDLKRITNSEVP